MSPPFVSVLIDTFNHEKFIEQAISSVLEQDFPASGFEILVVDDGSTDGTPEVVKKFSDRVTYLPKENGGQASAFNFGISHCRGEIVTFLDGDDWWQPIKLATVVYEFESNPEAGAVGHGFYEVDEVGKRLFLNVPDRRYSCHLRDMEEARNFLELRSFLGTSRLAIRRAVLDRILPLPEDLLVEADEFLATLAVAFSGCVVLDQPLTSYRFHSGNQFQYAAGDDRRNKRKATSLECLAKALPPRLRAASAPNAIVEFLTLPNWIDASRLRLSLGHGWPWETVRVERAAFDRAYKNASLGYHLFHNAVLAIAGLTPPKLFYRGRDWYARRRLARLRGIIGAPVPTDSLVIRKVSS